MIIFLMFEVPAYAGTREPAVSGAFYPDNPYVLRKTVIDFVKNSQLDKDIIANKEIVGLICPHAGYIYSGQIAGYSFKLLEGQQFDTVIVLGVNHRVQGFSNISIWNDGSFKTPLGEVEIDKNYADAIINEKPLKFVFFSDAHREEHSVEVQIPFLHVVLGDFKLVPIVMSDYNPSVCRDLANAILNNKGDRKILVIASTDLSHDRLYDTAVKMDMLGLDYARNLDIENLVKAQTAGETEMCGFGPVLTLMYLARNIGNTSGILLKYANSGDTTGDKTGRIVGYGAVAFITQTEHNENKEGEDMEKNGYTTEEKKALLKLARDTICDYLSKGKLGQCTVMSSKFNEKRGVFVTLHKFGELRGCIGYIEPIKPLQQAVMENAVNSAVEDPRFPKVELREIPDLQIEISVLTAPEEIQSPDQFITGIHGIIIKKGFGSSVFLPQVANEQGWTREETLSHLCLKAGLAPDEWKKSGMRFFIFTADVFSEETGLTQMDADKK